MKFLKWTGIIIIIIIALFLIIPLFLPSTARVERSITVEAPVDKVFQTAIDMNMRPKWDPWIEMDPDAKIITEVIPGGTGSWYTWDSEIIGKGKLTITNFEANKKINSKLEFIAPQSMTSDITWAFAETNEGTDITWGFKGELSYPVERWFGLFIDNQLGPQFEKGLQNFKTLVENLPSDLGRTGEIGETKFKGLMALSIKEECAMNNIRSKMINMYSSIMRYMNTNQIEMVETPFAIYHPSEKPGYTLLECGLPVNKEIKGNERIKFIKLPAGKTITASHFGPFHTVNSTYKAIENYIIENNFETTGTPWEIYITDPMKQPDQSKWETKVYFPVK
ncbi:MAG: GyrI-like domain-containing protein [Bacteroidales bacterium]